MKTYYPSTNQRVMGGNLQMVEDPDGNGSWVTREDSAKQNEADRLAVAALQRQINTLKAGVLGKFDAEGLGKVIQALRADTAGGTNATMTDLDAAADALEYLCELVTKPAAGPLPIVHVDPASGPDDQPDRLT
ncbi:hypothetical protein [Pseudomonas sp.]|jgi:hypothetical protein|uniref:hypothetical protein n=1 Tax=Pseudomonas sp. TaxID=306 RepID=UPI002ED83A5D